MNSILPQRVDLVCANCTSTGMSIFYDLEQVPVHSVLLHSSRQEAIEFPKGDICLGYCPVCGFIRWLERKYPRSFLSRKKIVIWGGSLKL